ncbi:MAG TPA: dethiobiotin synthase [Bryobacteraceae bacterium]|jgi:dethiobiotin synthetase/malonyl-CoA O-methyltransferase|nr:dethiobiotin synthase [Bryobacteraceae bacterium]
MLRGLFVTGTDTNVGKTVTAAAMMHRYRDIVPLRYWKPIQTGIEQDDDTAEVARLVECEAAGGLRLRDPVSPHLAAQRSGTRIDLETLRAFLPADADDARWIVEGAGGVLVPLNEQELMIDFMRAIGLPVVVVARSALGTINHTLLTVEALRARSLCVAGVVMCGERNLDNRAAIEHYGRCRVLGEMPVFQPLTRSALGEWAAAELDPQGHLLEFLR